ALRRRQGRQNGWQSLREHRFAGSGRANHEHDIDIFTNYAYNKFVFAIFAEGMSMARPTQANAALAYSYLRFSHPDQAKGDTLRRQKELREDWLARNGVSLDASLTLEDKGVSAYNGDHRDNTDRHALAAFLHLVEQGRISRGSYLIVESL